MVESRAASDSGARLFTNLHWPSSRLRGVRCIAILRNMPYCNTMVPVERCEIERCCGAVKLRVYDVIQLQKQHPPILPVDVFTRPFLCGLAAQLALVATGTGSQ